MASRTGFSVAGGLLKGTLEVGALVVESWLPISSVISIGLEASEPGGGECVDAIIETSE